MTDMATESPAIVVEEHGIEGAGVRTIPGYDLAACGDEIRAEWTIAVFLLKPVMGYCRLDSADA
jgi:hypothetical protein